MAVINEKFATGLFIGMTPAAGVLAARKADGTDAVLIAWDPVTGDATYSAPAGSAGGGGTRRFLFGRPIEVVGTVLASGALTIGGDLSFSQADPSVKLAANYYVKLTSATGVIDIVSNTITALSIANNGATITTPAVFTALAVRAGAAGWAGLGSFRLPNNAVVAWSNVAQSASLTLRVNTSDRFATDAGFDIGGSILPGTDNANDIGSGSFRWRNIFASGSVTSSVSGGGYGFIWGAGTANQWGWYADASGSYLRNLTNANAISVTFTNAGDVGVSNGLSVGNNVLLNNGKFYQARRADSAVINLLGYDVGTNTLRTTLAGDWILSDTGPTQQFKFTVSGQFYAGMVRPAGPITGTGVAVESTAGVVGSIGFFGPEATWTGSGTNSHLAIASYGGRDIIVHVDGSASQHSVFTTTGYRPGSDNAYDLGTAGQRWRDIYLSRRIYVYDTAYFVGNSAQGYRFNNDSDTENLFVILNSGDTTVRSANTKTGTPTRWAFNVQDIRTMAANVGGGILLSGYKTGTSAVGHFGAIAAYKLNATSGDETGGIRVYSCISGTLTRMIETASSTINFDGSLLPQTDNALDLGGPSNRWRDIRASRSIVSDTTIEYGGSNPATSGFIRLAYDQAIVWRNNGNTTNYGFKLTTTANIFLFDRPFGASGSWGADDGVRATITSTAGHACFQAWDQATSSDNVFVTFYTEGGSGTLRGKIDFNRGGGVTRYNTSSDMTLKTLIGDAPREDSLYILRNVRLREFYWNDDETRKPQIGPFAQELQRVFKGAVKEGGMRRREVDGKIIDVYEPWTVDKTAFAWHILAGWQDHDERIEALERRVAALTQ